VDIQKKYYLKHREQKPVFIGTFRLLLFRYSACKFLLTGANGWNGWEGQEVILDLAINDIFSIHPITSSHRMS
jgi:hypothetical protein